MLASVSRLCTAALLLCLGCSRHQDPPEAADSDESGNGEGIVSLGDGNASDGGSSGAGGSSGHEGESSSTGSDLQLSCNKIDFVFVIDNSSSMADEQQQLVAAVPGFVEAMRNALPTVQSFRVGVVDTDSYPGLGTLEAPLDGCPAKGADCESCDYTLGAFLQKPDSAADPATSCNFSTSAPFMEGASATFAEEFACAAIVGTAGNPVEQQVGALRAAVDPAMNAEGACNAGFSRDDALLVFLIISDEEDDYRLAPAPQGGSSGEPAQWAEAVLAAKRGLQTNVVALGLIGGSPRFPDCAALSADGKGAEQTTRMQSFLRMFDTHYEGSICSPGYDQFFADALERVAEGCVNFIP